MIKVFKNKRDGGVCVQGKGTQENGNLVRIKKTKNVKTPMISTT
jgi:hypothetical protein